MGPYPQEGILEFDYEEVEEFVSELRILIEELEEDVEEIGKAKEDLQGVANSRAIMEYGEYGVDIADYNNTIKFLEAIADDLQEFLDEVDEQAKFTREPNFYYDDQLIEEVEDLTEETEDLRNDNSICIADREYTPFGPFERGNFFHKGSDEEQLIDHNDGRMEQWAQEVNSILGDLVESAEEVERLHKLYFEDIAINDWKKSHDWHDGITEHSREIHSIGAITTTMMNLGTIPKSSYNANMGSKAKPKKVSEVSTQEVDDYVNGLLSKKGKATLTEEEVYEKINRLSESKIPQRPVNLEEIEEIKGSFSEEQVDKLVEMSTYNSESRTITLGKYNDKGQSYIINAIENESTYFSTGDEIWNAIEEAGFSKEEVWRLNEKVLDNAIAKGKTIEFSHNPMDYRKEESYFRLEIDYLEANGYEFKEIGGKWYARK